MANLINTVNSSKLKNKAFVLILKKNLLIITIMTRSGGAGGGGVNCLHGNKILNKINQINFLL